MMRSVCVPFLSVPFRPCIHCLIFCAFDTLVRSGFFFPRCYVIINLPLGTWRPLAPQRIWRTLCAIPACLAFSPTYKTGICIFIPLWPQSEIVSQLSPLWFQVIVWKRNHTKSRPADTNWQLLHWGKSGSFSNSPPFTLFQLHEVRVSLVILQNPCCLCACMYVQSERKVKALKHFENIRPNQGSFVQGPWETELIASHSDGVGRSHWQVLFCSYSLFVHLPAF